MRAEVYYFSGTGNSLAVARDIAEGIQGELIPIASAVGRSTIESDAEILGLVFPIYYETHGGLPRIVERFVGKLRGLEAKYLFAVTTYGSASTITLNRLARLLEARGGRLDGRFAVNMPENIHPTLAAGRHSRMFAIWREHAEIVCRCILSRRIVRLHTPNAVVGPAYPLLSALGRLLLPLFRRGTIRQLQRAAGSPLGSYDELLPLMDRSFATGEDCDGCGVCARLCPVSNIRMVEGRPSWLHRCEFCLACFHWCPRGAITSAALDSPVRYHHPDVKITDLLRR